MNQNLKETSFATAGGLKGVSRRVEISPDHALDEIYAQMDTHKGALLVSNYEVPDRYARFDIGFVNPPIEVVTKGRRFFVNALNGEGERLLPLLAPALAGHEHLKSFEQSQVSLWGEVAEPPAFFLEETRSKQPSIFSILRALVEHLSCGEAEMGFYGGFGFDLVFQFETLKSRHMRDPEQVDCHLFFPTSVVVVDRRLEKAFQIEFDFESPQGLTRKGEQGGREFPPPAPLPVSEGIACDHAPGEFLEKVERIREGCKKGDFFEVVLSQTFSMPYPGTPVELFRRICRNNPSPYSFLINMGSEQLVGASPEMYVRVQGRRMETSPISGTVPVGDSPMETAAQIKALISSEKEESELTMCTDVDRNDMTRVCKPGTVNLIGRRLIETYSRLVHTVDHVEGELAEGFDAIDAFATHLWACTVSGSPKPAALQIIEDLEKNPRRWYAGAVGFMSVGGDLNTGMTLRTVHLEKGLASVRAGATLLFDSDPEAEEKETRIKASAFLEATLGEQPQRPKPGGEERVENPGQGRKVLFVDFLDSFVHTLASYVRLSGAEVTTVRANFPDALFDELKPDLVFLSPGPGTPSDRGVAEVVKRAMERDIPIFGVCLGHQGISEVFGAKLDIQPTPMHGKPSPIFHKNVSIFKGLPSPFNAGRYHSIYVKRETLPPELEVTAETEDGMVMGINHKEKPVSAVQFHPESILTLEQEVGMRLIENLFIHFLDVHRPAGRKP